MNKVDVAINVYGKPLQTAVTLLSLVRHSGAHINKIYFIKERKQPEDSDFQLIYDLLGDQLVVYTPEHWLWINPVDKEKLQDPGYRLSVRYQFAWETSDCNYLYITHNDVLYQGDIIGALVHNIGDNIAIGRVGQCWNCPAFSAALCNGDKYLSFRPSRRDVLELAAKFPPIRGNYEKLVDKGQPWPLPECRLNEWVALIDMNRAKPITMPMGDCFPFGAMGLDIGTQWFRDVSLKGYSVKNYDFDAIAKHAWTTESTDGHSALFDAKLYDRSEAVAGEKLLQDFSVDARALRACRKHSPLKRLARFFFR